jgi:hypothetical protein
MGMHRASAAYAWFRQPKCVSDGRQPGGTRLEKPEWAPSALQQNYARFFWMVHPPNDYGFWMAFDSPNQKSSFNMPRWLLSGSPSSKLFTIRKIWIMTPKLSTPHASFWPKTVGTSQDRGHRKFSKLGWRIYWVKKKWDKTNNNEHIMWIFHGK